MAKRSDVRSFLEIVLSTCRSADLKNLLRDLKKLDRNIKIGASSKEKLVFENIAQALERGLLPISRLQRLVRDSEENDGHHHFYFFPRNRKISKQMNNSESVAKSLLGSKWKSVNRFENMPSEYDWAGFRLDKGANDKSIGWTATVYGQEEAERRFVEDKGDVTIIRKELEPVKVVLVARWREIGVLELRVPGIDPQSLIEEMHSELWEMLSKVASASDFKEWDLHPLRTSLVRRRLDSNQPDGLYTLGSSRARDVQGGSTVVKAEQPTTDLTEAEKRAAALKVFTSDGDNFDSLTVYWKPQKGSEVIPKSGLRTVIGPTRSTAEVNEVIFSSKATGGAADYVLNRLRDISRRESTDS